MQTKNQEDNFRWNVPDDYNIVDLVEGVSNRSPDRVAFYWENGEGETEELTYRGLKEESDKFGDFLIDFGLKRESPVLHILPRVLEVPIVQLGTFKAGCIAVPCSEMLKPKNIKYRAENSDADALVAHKSNADVVEEVKSDLGIDCFVIVGGEREGWRSFEEIKEKRTGDSRSRSVEASDPMTINYTSGTTGSPKPVVHKHRWMFAHNRITGAHWWGVEGEGEDELLWATTAPGWAKWYWSPIGVGLTNGLSQFIYRGEFDPEKYLRLMEKYEVTRFCATPTEYRAFAQLEELENFDIDLRAALSAGEPLNVEPLNAFRDAFGVEIRDGYGQTESVCLACNRPGMDVKPGSMGKPSPGMDLRIVDEEGEELPPGEVGEIALSPDNPGIFDGYWKSPELDREAFHGELYRTGDLARRDEDGYLWFEGRADDIIISSGYRIGPFEVEDSLVSHPAVKEAAAIGKPHEERGQIVKAFVIPSGEASPSEELVEEMQEFVKQDTAPYKYPREIEFVEELPKTKSGKIMRKKLRERE